MFALQFLKDYIEARVMIIANYQCSCEADGKGI